MNICRPTARAHRSDPVRLALSIGLAVHVAAATALSPLLAHAQRADPGCSLDIRDAEGPYDYRTQRARLGIVEAYHFTPKVERLEAGQSQAQPGGDIAYTLSKFPNHHRALASLSKLGRKLKVEQVRDMPHTVVCYFQRANHFRPDDTVVRLVFARHLGAVGRQADAAAQLDATAKYAKDNPITHYNIGLVALELKDYERALEHAHIAYRAGVTAPGLRDQLTAAGKWVELPAPSAAPTPSAASASSAATASTTPK